MCPNGNGDMFKQKKDQFFSSARISYATSFCIIIDLVLLSFLFFLVLLDAGSSFPLLFWAAITGRFYFLFILHENEIDFCSILFVIFIRLIHVNTHFVFYFIFSPPMITLSGLFKIILDRWMVSNVGKSVIMHHSCIIYSWRRILFRPPIPSGSIGLKLWIYTM